MAEKRTRLDTVIENLHTRAETSGSITFDSPEAKAASEEKLKGLFLKQISIISKRSLLSQKVQRRGRVGQNREEAKYYRKERRQAKKDIKDLNSSLQPAEKEVYEMITKLRNY